MSMPRLTEQALQALDRLSRHRSDAAKPFRFSTQQQENNLLDMGYAQTVAAPCGFFLTEPGKLLVEAYRIGQRSTEQGAP